MNLQQVTPIIEHSKNIISTTEEYYDFATLLSNKQAPVEFILATKGTTLSDKLSRMEVPNLVSLNAKYPWVITEYGHVLLNSTLYEITSCDDMSIIAVLVVEW